jgi:hypothetical protein
MSSKRSIEGKSSEKARRWRKNGEPSARAGWTGYTHQWREAKFSWGSRYFMASTDTVADRVEAVSTGWRFFGLASLAEDMSARTLRASGALHCPADKSGGRVECLDCLLCDGTEGRSSRSVVIPVHGIGAAKAEAVAMEV